MLRSAGGQDRPVGGQGAGGEHARPVLLAGRRGEHLTDGAGRHVQLGQVRQVLPPLGRPHPLAPGSSSSSSSWSSPSSSPLAREGRSGSSVRCQPSVHCWMRMIRALRAQAGQTASRVDPHGIGTTSSAAGGPVVDPAQHRAAAHPSRRGQGAGVVGGDGEVGPAHQAAPPSTKVSAGRSARPRAARSASVWWAKRTRTGSVMPSTWT